MSRFVEFWIYGCLMLTIGYFIGFKFGFKSGRKQGEDQLKINIFRRCHGRDN